MARSIEAYRASWIATCSGILGHYRCEAGSWNPGPRRLPAMTTLANVLALMGLAAIRFGGRGTGGFVFMLFGLTVLGVVVWALTRSTGNDGARSGGSSPSPGAPE